MNQKPRGVLEVKHLTNICYVQIIIQYPHNSCDNIYLFDNHVKTGYIPTIFAVRNFSNLGWEFMLSRCSQMLYVQVDNVLIVMQFFIQKFLKCSSYYLICSFNAILHKFKSIKFNVWQLVQMKVLIFILSYHTVSLIDVDI